MNPNIHVRDITEVQMLKEARDLLLDSEWIQGMNAGIKRWKVLRCSPMDKRANAFSLRGACIRVLKPSQRELSVEFHNDTGPSMLINKALGFKDGYELNEWNDNTERTKDDVINHINHCIYIREGS